MIDAGIEKKHFVLYDSKDIDFSELFTGERDCVFYTDEKFAFCKGCFDCWLKTPGSCIIRDRVYGLADNLSDCTDFIIVSRLLYGGFSTSVKGAVDRLIAFNLPYFKRINNELHHVPRYENRFRLIVFFYGEATREERSTAEEYVSRIALNLNNEEYTTIFIKDEAEWRGVYEDFVCGLQSKE